MRKLLSFGLAASFSFLWVTNAVAVVSHRAYYEVSLLKADQSSDVADATGEMILEMDDVCDGWSIEQKSSTTIHMKSRPPESLAANYVAWEAKGGNTLRFHSRRIFNQMFFEDVNGVAEFNSKDGGGKITFSKPQEMVVAVKPGTMPPIHHLHHLIKSAENGDKSVSKKVFDGSFFGDPVEINTFIGSGKPACKIAKGEKHVWPMRLAVYGINENRALPNFEIEQSIAANGVMCSYQVDFGAYAVIGKLKKIDYLPKRACGGAS